MSTFIVYQRCTIRKYVVYNVFYKYTCIHKTGQHVSFGGGLQPVYTVKCCSSTIQTLAYSLLYETYQTVFDGLQLYRAVHLGTIIPPTTFTGYNNGHCVISSILKVNKIGLDIRL